jgi:hypothetical protein
VGERVLIWTIDDGIERKSIETVIAKYLFYNVQNISALIMGHNEARVRIFNKITITHNTFLLNRLISQHYSIDGFFIHRGRNNRI